MLETLRSGRWPMTQLLIASELADAEFDAVWRLAAELGVDVERPSGKRLEQLCKSSDHQGYLAQMAEFPCESDTSLLELVENLSKSRQIGPDETKLVTTKSDFEQNTNNFEQNVKSGVGKSSIPLFLICDRIQDSHNFGAILRCCDAMGVAGVVIGAREQASVTPHVARASSGAVNFLRIFRSENLSACIRSLKENSIWIAGASEKGSGPAWENPINGPTALVIGSEARGISSEIIELCDCLLRIPMHGQGESLNAAVAAGILLYEIRRQHAERLQEESQHEKRQQQNCGGADDVARN